MAAVDSPTDPGGSVARCRLRAIPKAILVSRFVSFQARIAFVLLAHRALPFARGYLAAS
jgi:hypothetical protein